VTTGFRGRRVGKARAPPTTAVKPTRPGPRMNMRNVKQKQYSFRRQRREFNPQRGISEKVVSFNFSIPWAQIKFTALNAVQVIMTSSGSACGGQLYIYPQKFILFPGYCLQSDPAMAVLHSKTAPHAVDESFRFSNQFYCYLFLLR